MQRCVIQQVATGMLKVMLSFQTLITNCLPRIQVFWDAALCHSASGYWYVEGNVILPNADNKLPSTYSGFLGCSAVSFGKWLLTR